MKLDLRYLGRSEVRTAAWGLAMRLSPNLARNRVFYDAQLRHPLRFREAVSALHDVVVSDLRFKKRDKSAYEAWKADQLRQENQLRAQLTDQAKSAELAKLAKEPPPANLEADFHKMHALYWKARRTWAAELSRNDPELFRHLVPCDPVCTVAPDVVFFECFAKDESSYGCLTVARDAFQDEQGAGLGTTNVDYSLALYDHFQTLRTYRPTRLQLDPSGFEVKVEGHADYREEKIDLPATWLRGFGQIAAATTLPARRVFLSVETVYSILAHLKRHREKSGPRSIRFGLVPGKQPTITLDPWGIVLVSTGPAYDGPQPEEIRIWGRRRLFPLARVLPLAERVEVQLLGTGLPSIWNAHLGEMRFQLALSGWTTNDWTSSTNLESLAGDFRPDAKLMAAATAYLQQARSASADVLAKALGVEKSALMGSLLRLAQQGQLIFDHANQVFRFREVMPVALSEELLGPEPEEVVLGRTLAAQKLVHFERQEVLTQGRRLLMARVGSPGTPCEAILDADGALSRAKCGCEHFHKFRLRNGPCRHLLALRLAAPRGLA